MYKYYVTKKFLNGVLRGLTITQETNVKFTRNKIYKSADGTEDQYIVTSFYKNPDLPFEE